MSVASSAWPWALPTPTVTVAEIQFCDYGFNTIDLLKVAGNQRQAGARNYRLPMVVMMPNGSGIRGSLYIRTRSKAGQAGWRLENRHAQQRG